MALIGPRNSAPVIKYSLNTPIYELKLEKVFGLTVSTNAALACSSSTNLVAYPAGCTLVLLNTETKEQKYVENTSRKSVTCVAFTTDGRYLATGESGHGSVLRVWDLANVANVQQVAEFTGHRHGIICLTFSTSGKSIMSIGSQHDMLVSVWDWKSNIKLASNKVSSRVNAVSFSETGNFFVTVGFRHVKYWYLDCTKFDLRISVPLVGRSALLGELSNHDFCDVKCDAKSENSYTITKNGTLCLFNSRRSLQHWVSLRASKANCLTLAEEKIFIGCADGIVRCFTQSTLEYVTTIARPHYLGVDVSEGLSLAHAFRLPPTARFADVVAIAYNHRESKLTCVYNDHSLYVWDIRDMKRVGKYYSAMYHAACIWGVSLLCEQTGSFVTCSSDETIRYWKTSGDATNIYSNELTKIIYISKNYFKNFGSINEQDKTGVRCLHVSPDGRHIASGDRSGRIRIHSIEGKLLKDLDAHSSEVLCLEYSEEPRLLVSASRDRFIHVFSVDQDYKCLQTIDDHSSSITSVRFVSTSTGLLMVTCGADKTILFRKLITTPNGSVEFHIVVNVCGRSTLCDMIIDASGRHLLAACQDRHVRIYSTSQGKHTKTFRGTVADEGSLIKLALDVSGIYLATSSTDKVLCIFDIFSGDCMATMYGHSEIVTGLRYTPDCNFLISTSGDGCICIWRIPQNMVVIMQTRLSQKKNRHERGVSCAGVICPADLESEADATRKEVPCARLSCPADLEPEADSNRKGEICAGVSFSANLEPEADSEDKEVPRSRVSCPANLEPEADSDRNIHVTPLPSWAVKSLIPQDSLPLSEGSRHTLPQSGVIRPLSKWATPKQRVTSIDGIIKVLDEDIYSTESSSLHTNEIVGLCDSSVEDSPESDKDLGACGNIATMVSNKCMDVETSPGLPSHASRDVCVPEKLAPACAPVLSELQGRCYGREVLSERIRETKRQLDSVASHTLRESSSVSNLSICKKIIKANTIGHYNAYICPEEYYDSLNPYQNMYLDNRNKNPYAIPANSNHKFLNDYDIKPYVPPHANLFPTKTEKRPNMNFNQSFIQVKPMVFKDQLPQHSQQFPPVSPDVRTHNKAIASKVFNRLFPNTPLIKYTKDPPKPSPRNLNLTKNFDAQHKVTRLSNTRSIFKNYKSCPVSPVSEECKWADKAPQNIGTTTQQTKSLDPKKRHSLGFGTTVDANYVLADRAKSIMDTIKSDTEKMIAEITQKYGDLDEYEPNNDNLVEQVIETGNGNFSSDSLEDCSLDQDVSCKNKLYSKKVCRKHNKNRGLPPRRAVSNYEIYENIVCKPALPIKPQGITTSRTLPRNMPSSLDDIMDDKYSLGYPNMHRCQSVLTKRCITTSNESVLSDNSNCSSVTNEIFFKYGNQGSFQQAKFGDNNSKPTKYLYDNIDEPDDQYFERHRHSSASFFLNQKKYIRSSYSQESILSDEMNLDEHQLSRTNCNSLESVLSDESECTKSAPLEMLLEGARSKCQHNIIQQKHSINIPRSSKSCYEFENTSKSYGSSPNPNMGTFMYDNYLGESSSPIYRDITCHSSVAKVPINTVYGFDIPITESSSSHKTVTRSRNLYVTPSKQVAPSVKNVAYYFDGNKTHQPFDKETDEIPRISSNNFMVNQAKSLESKFSEKNNETVNFEVSKTNSMVKSKSCSFDVVLEPTLKTIPGKTHTEIRSSHVQKNLEKFEEQIRKNMHNRLNKCVLNKENTNRVKHNNTTKSLERGAKNYNNKIIMEFVPHKPPKPIKRTSSVKLNNRLKTGVEQSGTISTNSSQYKAKLDGLQDIHIMGHKKHHNKIDECASGYERTFEMFIKENGVKDNKSEMHMDSVQINRIKQISMDSLDVLQDIDDFSKDSLDYSAENNRKYLIHKQYHKSNQSQCKLNNVVTSSNNRFQKPKENLKNVELLEEIKNKSHIERKSKIITNLVEMEEQKILHEKMIKQWRMRPLKANINDNIVKVLSRKFETLAHKQPVSLTLEEVKLHSENCLDTKAIKRNLSLPDILDTDQIIGLRTHLDELESTDDAENPDFDFEPVALEKLNNLLIRTRNFPPRSLKQRVYNEMSVPKTDVHVDSENYESSTTSSSGTNSPNRLPFFGRHKPTFVKKVVKEPTLRLYMESKTSHHKVRPNNSNGYGVRGSVTTCKRVPSQPTVSAPTTVDVDEYNDEGPSAGLRRAVSLSDLSAVPVPAPRKLNKMGSSNSIRPSRASVRPTMRASPVKPKKPAKVPMAQKIQTNSEQSVLASSLLCGGLALQLTQTAARVMELYTSLQQSAASDEIVELRRVLERACIVTRGIVEGAIDGASSISACDDYANLVLKLNTPSTSYAAPVWAQPAPVEATLPSPAEPSQLSTTSPASSAFPPQPIADSNETAQLQEPRLPTE